MLSKFQYAATGASLILLSAYVSYVAQDDRDTIAAWTFLMTGLALSSLSFLPLVWPVRWRDLWKRTAVVQHVTGIAVACALQDLSAYCVAFSFAFFFTSIVTLADDRGFVRYNAGVGFSVSSASLYAVLRVVSRVLVREVDTLGPWFSLLFPFIASSLETLGMLVSVTNSYYSFPSESRLFVIYSLLKASIFLALPRVENALVANFGQINPA